ncbi:MAG: GMC family oxidoreductase [Candidatus Lustribacter sp.]|jgi:gluconate 2-dehydrogenase alpha chain
MATETTDVILIGAGAAGGILAKQLGTAGLKVVAFDRGAMLTLEDYAARDEIKFVVRGAQLEWARHDPVAFRNTPAEASTLKYDTVSGVGGQMLHWTAQSSRLLPGDFKVATNEIASGIADRAGADLSGYEIYDWPIAYDDLEPYYERFEWEFGISGDSGARGANPFAGPRRHGFPLPGLRTNAKMEIFRRASSELGYHPYDGAAGVLSQKYRPAAPHDTRIPERPACTYCGHCNDYGCHVQAKADALYSIMPAALTTGNVDLRTNTRVVRIDLDDTGRAAGVTYFTPERQLVQLRAKAVVLCGYTFENSRLLLASERKGTRGIANSSGQVGHGAFGHGDVNVFGLFDDYIVNSFIGPNSAATRIDDFNGNNFDHTGLGFIRGAGIGTSGSGTPVERYNTFPPEMRGWGKTYKEFLAHAYTRTVEVNVTPETLAHRDNRIDLDPDHNDDWGVPLPRLTFSFHQNERRMHDHLAEVGRTILRKAGAKTIWTKMPGNNGSRWAGGTRMGSDPATSVVDANCRTHDVENLFVTGASVFPTLTGFPPTATVGALAYRTADYLIAQRDLFH